MLVTRVGAATQQATSLQAGDVIFQVNRTAVGTAEELQRAFAAAAGRGAVTLWFERRGATWRSTFYVR